MIPATLLPLAAAFPRANFPQTTTEPATAWMRSAAALFEREAPVAIIAVGLVLLLLFVSVLRRRGTAAAAPGAAAKPGLSGLAWTLAPWGIMALLALPPLLAGLRPPAAPANALRVRVIGHQWWWEFRYPDLGVVTATDVHVPLGRPVQLMLESADVTHSLWIPAVGPRQDVPPLRRRPFSFTPDRAGVFPGQCAELCGMSHAHMHLKLFVDTPAAFATWLANERAPRAVPPDSLHAGPLWRGEQVFVAHACRGCHTVRGLTEGPVGPDLTHFASRTTIAGGMFERTDSSLVHWILNANTLKQGSTMPGFPVPEKDMKPLVAWLQSLR